MDENEISGYSDRSDADCSVYHRHPVCICLSRLRCLPRRQQQRQAVHSGNTGRHWRALSRCHGNVWRENRTDDATADERVWSKAP